MIMNIDLIFLLRNSISSKLLIVLFFYPIQAFLFYTIYEKSMIIIITKFFSHYTFEI